MYCSPLIDALYNIEYFVLTMLNIFGYLFLSIIIIKSSKLNKKINLNWKLNKN